MTSLIAIAGVFWMARPHSAAAIATTLATPYDDDRDARNLFMAARFELASRSAESLHAAERDYKDLVARRPDRAAGWSGLAETYILLREFGATPDGSAFPQAEIAAEKALALDPGMADAWLDRAFIAWWWEGNPEKSFASFDKAIAMSPNTAKAYHWYATALQAHGDFGKSLLMMGQARSLDPTNRAIIADEAVIRFDAGYPTEALIDLERGELQDPSFVSWHLYLAYVYLRQARHEDFLREAIKSAELRGKTEDVAELRLAAARLKEDGASAMLDFLARAELARATRGTGSPVRAARYFALADDRTNAFRAIELGFASHDPQLVSLRAIQEFNSYRSDPEFAALLARAPQVGTTAQHVSL